MHLRWGLAVAACIASAPSRAAADDDEVDEHELQIHAFVSQSAMISSGNNYLAFTKGGTLELWEAGINLRKELSERLSVGAQLFAFDLGPHGDYRARFDWALLDFRWQDWLGVRAGRVKLPIGLYNEIIDVDAARPNALLPSSVYPLTNRQITLAHTGVELYGFRALGKAGALEYRAYAGSLDIGIDVVESITTIHGARVMWELPVDGLRVGGSALEARLHAEATVPPATPEEPPSRAGADFRVRWWLASLEYVIDDLLVAFEYGRQHNRIEATGVEPQRFTSITEVGYLLAAYRLERWVQVAGYYSMAYPDLTKRIGREARQVDAALTLRFDLNPHWIVKLEGHAVRGTAQLEPALNDDLPRSSLVNRWYFGLLKTTVYF